MTKNKYMNDLKRRLRKLPHEDYEEAISYYEGYFEDAESPAAAIEQLGTPDQVAAKIFADTAARPKNKMGLMAILLIICSFPILFPLGLALFILIIALAATLFALIVAFGAVALVGIVGAALSFALIAVSPITTIFFVGLGAFMLMLGYLVIKGLIVVSRWLIRALSNLGVKILRRFAK